MKRIHSLAIALGLSVISAKATMIFEISTYARIQTADVLLGTFPIALQFQFDPSLPDKENNPTTGIYESNLPFQLTIGNASVQGTSGFAIKVGFDSYPQDYVVFTGAYYGPEGAAYFLGRRLHAFNFHFLDRDQTMFSSDALPTDSSFSLSADSFASSLIFEPLPGDPGYGSSAGTTFWLFDPSYEEGTFVHAPLTLVAVPELGGTGVLLGAACALLLIVDLMRRRA